MGCGASQQEWDFLHHGTRQRIGTPEDPLDYRYIRQMQNLQNQKLLPEIRRSVKQDSNQAWFDKTNLEISQMARDNVWLKSLFYAPSKQVYSKPVLPDLSSWPQEAAPIDKVMIGKHRSDIGLVSGPRISKPVLQPVADGLTGSGDGGHKRKKKAKVICYLPVASPKSLDLTDAALAKQTYGKLQPLSTKPGTPPLSSRTSPLPPISKDGRRSAKPSRRVGPCEAEPIRTAYAKSQTAEHFGAVVRAKAVFTERFNPHGHYPVVSVCEDFPAVQLVVNKDGKIREEPASCDRVIPEAGPDPLERPAKSPSVIHDLKTIRSVDVITMDAVPYEVSSATPPNTKRCFPWLENVISADKLDPPKERPETRSPIGADAYTPVCPVVRTGDPKLSCVHNLKRYGHVAYESAQTIDIKQSYSPLCEVKAVGPTSAVKTSFAVIEMAETKRALLKMNLKETKKTFYQTAPVLQIATPMRALGEYNPPQPGLAVCEYIQTDDSLQMAVTRSAHTHYVCKSQRCKSACLEAVETVEYDKMFRLTGDEELDYEIIAPQLHNQQDDVISEIKARKEGREGAKGDALKLSFIRHEKGFVPAVDQDEPMIVKNRILLNVEDLAPSVRRGPNPERRRSTAFSVRGRVSELPALRFTPRPPSAPRPASMMASRPHSQQPSRPPT